MWSTCSCQKSTIEVRRNPYWWTDGFSSFKCIFPLKLGRIFLHFCTTYVRELIDLLLQYNTTRVTIKFHSIFQILDVWAHSPTWVCFFRDRVPLRVLAKVPEFLYKMLLTFLVRAEFRTLRNRFISGTEAKTRSGARSRKKQT